MITWWLWNWMLKKSFNNLKLTTPFKSLLSPGKSRTKVQTQQKTGHAFVTSISVMWFSFYLKPEFLHNPGIFSCRHSTVLLWLGPGADHFTRAKDEGGSPGFTDSHDHSSKSLRIVLSISCLKEGSKNLSQFLDNYCMWSIRSCSKSLGLSKNN